MLPETARCPSFAFAELGRLVRTHSPLLLRHERGKFTVTTDAIHVIAVPRRDPVTGSRYVYVINKDAERRARGILTVRLNLASGAAVDIYTGRKVFGSAGQSGTQFQFVLAPGEGQLWRLPTLSGTVKLE